jgi:hypothetical protein
MMPSISPAGLGAESGELVDVDIASAATIAAPNRQAGRGATGLGADVAGWAAAQGGRIEGSVGTQVQWIRRRAPSIYEHIRQQIPVDGPGLLDGGERLPDEDEQDTPIRFAPGARDGMATHHLGVADGNEQADEAFAQIFELVTSRRRRRAGFERLYALLRTSRAVSLLVPLLERIQDSPLPVLGVHRLGP